MRLKEIIICLLSISYIFAYGQSSITFYSNTELSNLLKIAQEQDKNIFVDTYARWCKPCKRQAKTFMDSEVANYFNANFINVKYDMDTQIGEVVDLKYGVVFLPTILILDKYGNVRIKLDNGVVGPAELLQIAKAVTKPFSTETIAASPPVQKQPIQTKAVEPPPVLIKPAEPVSETPVVQAAEIKDEKILFVLDGDVDLPPEILLKEAYFRMRLMDGTHREAARSYLITQKDWSTEENIKFIHDFVYTTRSDEFNFLIKNRELFNAYVGEEKVVNTIEYLVYNTLYNGYPRPTLEKAIELFSYIDPHNNIVNAYKYFLTRLHEDENKTKYLEFAERYLDKQNKLDHKEMYRLAQTLLTDDPNENQIKQSELWINKAIELHNQDTNYFELLAKILVLKGDTKEASAAIQKAISLSESQEKDTSHLKEMLNSLD